MTEIAPWIWATIPVAVIYLGHLWYGADSIAAATVMASLEVGVLLVFLARDDIRRRIAGLRFLPIIAICYAICLFAAVSTLFSFPPVVAHPIWGYVGSARAIAIDRSAVVVEMVKLMGLAGIFLTGVAVSADATLGARIRQLIVWCGAAFSVASLLIFAAGAQIRPGPRLAGPFDTANNAGMVFAMLFILTLASFIHTRRGRAVVARANAIEERLVTLLVPVSLIVLQFVCVLLSASRGALIAMIASLLAFIGLQAWHGRVALRRMIVPAIALTGIGAGLLLIRGELVLARFADLSASVTDRQALVANHWKAALQSPIFGSGLGSFRIVNSLILDPTNFASIWRSRSLHNVYLQWMEEGGLAGTLPMFAAIAVIIFAGFRGLGRMRRYSTWLAGLLAVNVVVLIQGLSDFALQEPSIAAFWALLLGLQLGVATRT